MEHSPPPLFKQGPSARLRLTLFVVLSLTLLVLDGHYKVMNVIRQTIGTGLYPFQNAAALPLTAFQGTRQYLTSLFDLQIENKRLTKQHLIDQQKLLSMQTIETENLKLRNLMNVERSLKVQRSIMTEVKSDMRDPFSRKVIVGKGSLQGVQEGMPVIDELGLLGQVTRVFPAHAEVSLITDKDQIIPVENLRNGLRSVVYGGLEGGQLELRFTPTNADMEVDDLMVTSGLDGVYPRGIPVARINRVERNPRYAFASIFCDTVAAVEQHRFVLILNTEHIEQNTSETATPSHTGEGK